MKILMINRYGYRKYGSESYFLDLCRLLKEKGHKVIIFTTKDERNVDEEYAGYYIDRMDLDDLDSMPLLHKMARFPRTIYSFEAKQKIERLIRDTRPDIVHLHNIKRLISPSILHAIKKFKIPVVCTVHDYHLLCPNYRLFSKGRICEDCKGGRYYNAVFKKCVRNSRALSIVACVEQYVHGMLNIFEDTVDMFISPSRFLQDKMIAFGFKPGKITYLPYFIHKEDYQPGNGFLNYIVYCGRLVPEKGISALIRAVHAFPSIRLFVLGEGESRKELESLLEEENSNNVEFKGYLAKDALRSIIQDALFVVVPSLWYDNSPVVIYEAFAMGKPVIGADVGGIGELIDDTVDGFLFKPGDVGDLAEKMRRLLNNRDRIAEMGNNGRRKVLGRYAAEPHYQKIVQIYRGLIAER